MAHHNTVFAQWLKLVPRHEFESLANPRHRGRKLRKITRWAQFVAMATAQLSDRHSLRDVASNLMAQAQKRYHLGICSMSRSSFSRVNESQPYERYEARFAKLLARCQAGAPRHNFKFKNKLYSLDASTIDRCLSVFPWAKFRATKGAVKLPVGLDHEGLLPAFVAITDGITAARAVSLPRGSIVVMDRGYTDYAWYNQRNNNDISFVTRLKTNARYRVIERRTVLKTKGLTCAQTIELTGARAKDAPSGLRRMGYKDADTGIHYPLMTNHVTLTASTIADIYKARWQIELFFKWIKQNLKVKSFLGASKNAVMTQIWIAMCVYLLLSYIKFLHHIPPSLQQILRRLQLNLFERRDLLELLRGDPPEPLVSRHQAAPGILVKVYRTAVKKS